MSNDKTLAGVQPGGRVRLGDQAELDRLEFQAWARWFVAPVERDEAGDYVSDFTRGLWCAWQAALSARPPVRIYGCCAQPEGELHTAECPNMRHLAARQPVGEIDEAAVLRRAAAVLHMWEDDPNLTGYMGDFKDACDILELLAQHAGPPAQAVDLGQFRPAVECWRWTKAIAVNSGELDTEMKRSALFEVNEADRLLALIDSQAVGK